MVGATTATVSGRHGELRYYARPVAMLRSWTRTSTKRNRALGGAEVATLTFDLATVNQFWANFAAPTHVALPIKQGGPRRVYELVHCDMRAGRASFRTPACAFEGEKR